ncbi:peptide deformylase [Pseudochelatococcus lubricantis]|uniref:peptide deformylase n=1 Tax=Pseudochelatococcus lubricantis TaxID=1538102 RepID=UPI003630439E
MRRKILKIPDTRLRMVSKPQVSFNKELQQLAADMAETMYAAKGIGLAAPQIGVDRRVIVADVSDSQDSLHVLVNPVIVDRGGSASIGEGCLSIPNAYAKVNRSAWVTVGGCDANGSHIEVSADGMLAMVLQHEIDHLDGILFFDHLAERTQRALGLTDAVRQMR